MIADHPIEMFHHEDDEQDWLPAIMRAQLQFPSRLEHPFQPTHEPDPQHPIWPGHAGWEDRQGDHGAGFTLRFAARTYRFSGPIPIIRGMRLTGAGGGALGTTRFKFDAPLPARRDGMTVNPPPELGQRQAVQSGIIVHSANTARLAGYEGDGYGTIIENLWLEGNDGYWLNRLAQELPRLEGLAGPLDEYLDQVGDGITAHALVRIRNVSIRLFRRDGIHIAASLRGEEHTKGNAGFWSVEESKVVLCGRHGLSIEGADSSAGEARLLECLDNGGWAVRDDSGTGCTFTSCGSHHNGFQIISPVPPNDPAISPEVRRELTGWSIPGDFNLQEPQPVANWILFREPPGITISTFTCSVTRIWAPNEPPRRDLPAEPYALLSVSSGAPEADGDRPRSLTALHTRLLQENGVYMLKMTALVPGQPDRRSAAFVRVNRNIGGSYTNRISNNRAQFLNCYAEGDNPGSTLHHPAQFIGGLHHPPIRGSAFTMLADRFDGHHVVLEVPGPEGPRSTEMVVGSRAGDGAYLKFKAAQNVNDTSFRYNYGDGAWDFQGEWVGFNWAGSTNHWSMMLPLNFRNARVKTSDVPKQSRAAIGLPQWGLYAGTTWIGVVPPNSTPRSGPPHEGTWDAGDIVFNPRAAAGPPEPDSWNSWIGGICVQGGTSGQYQESSTQPARTATVYTVGGAADEIKLDGPTEVLAAGDFITLSSASGSSASSRIQKVDGQLVKLRDNIAADLPRDQALRITFTEPRWKRFGALEP